MAGILIGRMWSSTGCPRSGCAARQGDCARLGQGTQAEPTKVQPFPDGGVAKPPSQGPLRTELLVLGWRKLSAGGHPRPSTFDLRGM